MKLSEILCSDSIIVPLKAVKRDDAIKELVDILSSKNHLGKACKDEIAKAIIKRENDASTGIGKGVAVPHVKHNVVDSAVVAIGVSEKGIDFSSLDKQPVFTVMLLVSSAKDTDKHLQAMEQIFRLLQNDKSRKFLRQSTTVDQIKEVVTDFEEGRI